MGMTERLTTAWASVNAQHLETQRRASDVAGGLSAASRVFRMFLQSGVLAVGAYLVINQEATAGVIIASSILVSRALAPVELTIANWKGFVAARQSWRRLSDLLVSQPAQVLTVELPSPVRSLQVERLSVAPPGGQKPIIQDIAFELKAGQALAIIGPTASGKSSLARGIVGVWPALRGEVRLDGVASAQWKPAALGQYIGYLPQDIELFDGTVAENIARFELQPRSSDVVAAARDAGVHELILRLPDGYETRIGEAGAELSAGQRQRIALARALYREPFLVVLDEPNSNLDAEGEAALGRAIQTIRERGGIVVVIAHRPAVLANVDFVLAMANGRIAAFGPKDEVLKSVLQPGNVAKRSIGDVVATRN
jgi:ATP-binding cassette subfamily C protein